MLPTGRKNGCCATQKEEAESDGPMSGELRRHSWKFVALCLVSLASCECQEESVVLQLQGDAEGDYEATWEFASLVHERIEDSGNIILSSTMSSLPTICAAQGDYSLQVWRACAVTTINLACLVPTSAPTPQPSLRPTTREPTTPSPTRSPVQTTDQPTRRPSLAPTRRPTVSPTPSPSTARPTVSPTTRCLEPVTLVESGTCTSAGCSVLNQLEIPSYDDRCVLESATLTASFAGDVDDSDEIVHLTLAENVADLGGTTTLDPIATCSGDQFLDASQPDSCRGNVYASCEKMTGIDVSQYFLDISSPHVLVVESHGGTTVDDCGSNQPAFRVKASLQYAVCCNAPSSLPTLPPTPHPSRPPTIVPTSRPTPVPTSKPTVTPTSATPTARPTLRPTTFIPPTKFPTPVPTTRQPTTSAPSLSPTTSAPSTNSPTSPRPTRVPTALPSREPSSLPSPKPTQSPTTDVPTSAPTARPTSPPTPSPTTETPTPQPTLIPSSAPTVNPTTANPSSSPSAYPSIAPTVASTAAPSSRPTTAIPSSSPTGPPTQEPTPSPTVEPTPVPTTPFPTATPPCLFYERVEEGSCTGFCSVLTTFRLPNYDAHCRVSDVNLTLFLSGDINGDIESTEFGTDVKEEALLLLDGIPYDAGSCTTSGECLNASFLTDYSEVRVPGLQTCAPYTDVAVDPSLFDDGSLEVRIQGTSSVDACPFISRGMLSATICCYAPTPDPTSSPTLSPSQAPVFLPTLTPGITPTRPPLSVIPTSCPSVFPTTAQPSSAPSNLPTSRPTQAPTGVPSAAPTGKPSPTPSHVPTQRPTPLPTTILPTQVPVPQPTASPTRRPTAAPSTLAPTTACVDEFRIVVGGSGNEFCALWTPAPTSLKKKQHRAILPFPWIHLIWALLCLIGIFLLICLLLLCIACCSRFRKRQQTFFPDNRHPAIIDARVDDERRGKQPWNRRNNTRVAVMPFEIPRPHPASPPVSSPLRGVRLVDNWDDDDKSPIRPEYHKRLAPTIDHATLGHNELRSPSHPLPRWPSVSPVHRSSTPFILRSNTRVGYDERKEEGTIASPYRFSSHISTHPSPSFDFSQRHGQGRHDQHWTNRQLPHHSPMREETYYGSHHRREGGRGGSAATRMPPPPPPAWDRGVRRQH